MFTHDASKIRVEISSIKINMELMMAQTNEIYLFRTIEPKNKVNSSADIIYSVVLVIFLIKNWRRQKMECI